MPFVYRIQKKAFVESMLTGEGARLNGGRWNPIGTPLLYTSTTPELALLETLVHLDGTPLRDLPPFVRVTLELPDSIEIIAENDLPDGWEQLKYPDALPLFLVSKLTPNYPVLAFSVPSVIVRGSPSRNILINPLHPLLSGVKVVEVVAHEFDSRLQKDTVSIEKKSKRPRSA